jgi:hypothetical protein
VLRDYAYRTDELDNCLNRFRLPEGSKFVDVKLFRMLTPDSFIWKLRHTDSMYYLYAEDYVPSLAHVRTIILGNLAHGQSGHFIEATTQIAFNDLSAVRSAVVYRKPDDYDSEIIKYTIDSGHDLVFLYRVDAMSDKDKEEF